MQTFATKMPTTSTVAVLALATLDSTIAHKHLRNIDCLTVHTACLVCFIITVNGHSKTKKKRRLLWAALVAGTQQNLSNLFLPFDIYAIAQGSQGI
jgi:hypothetical protein